MNKANRNQEFVEIQFEPGSKGKVLANFLEIKTELRMDEAEALALLEATDLMTTRISKSHRFIAQEICDMHRIWLGKIYPWAGRYRQVQISKGNLYFASAPQIPTLMENFERNCLGRFTPCNFPDISGLAQALAETHVELILIHPFRKGNIMEPV
jgi:cell filamentation protein